MITFSGLPIKIIHQVVQKFILQLEAQLTDRNVTFELSEDAIAWLAKRGYDDAFGARPLARTIQDSIKKPLADEILFGKLAKGGIVKIGVKDDKLAFDIIEAPPRGGASAPGEEDDDPDADDKAKEPELVG